MDPETHPSFLALDRFAMHALEGSAALALEQHVADCARCRAHVDALREPLSVPRWVTERVVAPSAPSAWAGWAAKLRSGPGLVLLAGAAVALVAVVLGRGMRSAEEPSYVASRGAAAVGLYVKRGEHVFLWDGQQRVRAGDLLRLKVLPEGFTQVAVFTQDAPATAPDLLEVRTLGNDKEFLFPSAWKVDQSTDAETLIVVLARGLTVAQLRAHAGSAQPPANVWVRRLTLDKEPPLQPSTQLPGSP